MLRLVRVHIRHSIYASSVASLTFTSLAAGDSLAQSFELTLPVRTAAATALALVFTLSGDDVEHYAPVSTIPLTLVAQANFILGGLPTAVYVSKSAVITLAPAVAPDVNTHVRVSVSVSGAGGTVGPVTSDTDAITSAAAAATTSETILAFVAGSTAAVPFTYYAPLTFSGDGIFTLTFAVVESGDNEYLPIPSVSSQLIAPVAVSIEDAPQSILNRETSAPLTLRIASTPLTEVTYTFRSDLADVQFTPASLTFRGAAAGAGDSIHSQPMSQTFTVSAPYWYPRGFESEVSPLLNILLEVTGPDTAMFALHPRSLWR